MIYNPPGNRPLSSPRPQSLFTSPSHVQNERQALQFLGYDQIRLF